MADLTASAPILDGPAARSDTRRGLPILAAILLLCLMIPANFTLGTVVLNPSRLFCLIVTLPLLGMLFAGKFGRILAADVLVLLFMFWMTLTLAVNRPTLVVQYAGSMVLTMLGPYLIARASIRSREDFIALIKFLMWLCLLMLPFAVKETLDGQLVIPPLIEKIPGVRSVQDIFSTPRMGFERVQVVFAHSIHFGLFCSMTVALVFVGLRYDLSTTKRHILTLLMATMCFLSLSSGPFLAMIAQFALIFYAYVMRSVDKRWAILLIGLAMLYLVLEVLSSRPAYIAVVTRLAFNSATAYHRSILLEAGIQQISQSPIWGLTFGWFRALPPWMSGSVDNFWLFIPLQFGLPAFIFLLGAVLTGIITVGRRNFHGDDRLCALRQAWVFLMIGLNLSLCTVYIWGEVYSLVWFMFASGLWFLSATPITGETAEAPVEERPAGNRYTRFAPAGPRPSVPRSSGHRRRPA